MMELIDSNYRFGKPDQIKERLGTLAVVEQQKRTNHILSI
jgi:hypothetical protein